MLPSDLFGVAARILGVWTVIEGLRGFVTAFGFQKGWFTPPDQTEYFLLNSIMEIAAGVFLLRATNSLTKFTYAEDIAPSVNETTETSN